MQNWKGYLKKMNELNLIILDTAQRELEEFAKVRTELVGGKSARKFMKDIYSRIELLKTTPLMGTECDEPPFEGSHFRKLVCKNYLCFYKVMGDTVYIYHVADGRTDYPALFRR